MNVFAKKKLGVALLGHDVTGFGRYLYGSFDINVLLTKVKGKRKKPAESDITLIAKFKNIGTTASAEAKVKFYLCEDDEYDAESDDLIALMTVDLPSIEPNKSKKIKTKATLPSWLDEGEYYLIAVFDPDGDSGDSNTANNHKVSKKPIEIF